MPRTKHEFGSGADHDFTQLVAEKEAFIEWMATPENLRELRTYQAFADHHGISRGTLYFWKDQPETQSRIQAAVRQAFGIEKLGNVIDSLYSTATAGDGSSSSVTAARTILDWYHKTEPKESSIPALSELSDRQLRDLAAKMYDELDDRIDPDPQIKSA